MIERPAFLTGSKAYGTPTDDSDTNIVVLVSEIWEQNPMLHIGDLSVHLVFSNEEWDAWRAATERMIGWKNQGWPVPKEQARLEVQNEITKRKLVPF